MQHAVVFCFGRNNPLNTQIAYSALQGHVVGFCATRSKEDLADRSIQLVGYLLAGTFNSSPGLSSFRVDRRRIAKIALHRLQHAIDGGSIEWGGGRIVKIYPHREMTDDKDLQR